MNLIRCPGCHKRLRFKDEFANRKIHCPKCSIVVLLAPPAAPPVAARVAAPVPAGGPPPLTDYQEAGDLAFADPTPLAGDDYPQAVPVAADDDLAYLDAADDKLATGTEADQPPRKKGKRRKKKSSPVLILLLVLFLLVAAILGGVWYLAAEGYLRVGAFGF